MAEMPDASSAEVMVFPLSAVQPSYYPLPPARLPAQPSNWLGKWKKALSWQVALFQDKPMLLEQSITAAPRIAPSVPPALAPAQEFVRGLNEQVYTHQQQQKPAERCTFPPKSVSCALMYGYLPFMFLLMVIFARSRPPLRYQSGNYYNVTSTDTEADVLYAEDPTWLRDVILFLLGISVPEVILLVLLTRAAREQTRRVMDTQYVAAESINKVTSLRERLGLGHRHVGVYWRSKRGDRRITSQSVETILAVAPSQQAVAHPTFIFTQIHSREIVVDVLWRELPMACTAKLGLCKSRAGWSCCAKRTYFVVPTSDADDANSLDDRYSPAPCSSPPVLVFDGKVQAQLAGHCSETTFQELLSQANTILSETRQAVLNDLPWHRRRVLAQAFAPLFVAFVCCFVMFYWIASAVVGGRNRRDGPAQSTMVFVVGIVMMVLLSVFLGWRQTIVYKYFDEIFTRASARIEVMNSELATNANVHNLRVELFRAPTQTEDAALRFIKKGPLNDFVAAAPEAVHFVVGEEDEEEDDVDGAANDSIPHPHAIV